MKPLLVMTLSATFLCSGCALIWHGTSQRVYVDSVPPGAKVMIDEVPTQTPASVTLARCRSHPVYARNDKGALVYRYIESSISGSWHLLDLICCPIVCNLIDMLASADCELEPASLTIPLPPADAGPEYRSIQAAQ